MTATTPAAPSALPPLRATAGGPFAGTGALLRFALRRDRVRIPVWLASLSLGNVLSAQALIELYGGDAERRTVVETMDTPAGLAFTGPAAFFRDYSVGAMVSHQVLGFMVVFVGIMSVLMVVRHTRAEEEAGRAELVRAGRVGRHAHLAAALSLTAIVNVALGALVALGLASLGTDVLPWTGSLLYGAANAAVGLAFAGLAAVTVQVTAHSRGASGLAMALVGGAYLVRAAGDSAGSALSWASPIGWAQQTLPYLDDRWWPLALHLFLAAGAAVLGFALSVRRDLGAGLRAARRGRPTASRALRTPWGFALRLHRGLLVGFGVAMLAAGMTYGPFLGDVEEIFQDVAAIQDALARIGGATFVDSFVAMVMTVLAVLAAVYSVAASLRARSEEVSGRAEPVLATWQSRPRWLWSHVVVALVGGPLMILAAGAALAVTGAPTVEDGGELVGPILGAAAAYVPALWLLTGVAVLLVGWFPRAAGLAWLPVVYVGVVGYLGPILQLPDWSDAVSPFGHTPRVPVEDVTWTPLLVMTAIAALLVAVGVTGVRRRDLETT